MSKDILLKNGLAKYENDVVLKRDQKRDGGILVKNFILITFFSHDMPINVCIDLSTLL